MPWLDVLRVGSLTFGSLRLLPLHSLVIQHSSHRCGRWEANQAVAWWTALALGAFLICNAMLYFLCKADKGPGLLLALTSHGKSSPAAVRIMFVS